MAESVFFEKKISPDVVPDPNLQYMLMKRRKDYRVMIIDPKSFELFSCLFIIYVVGFINHSFSSTSDVLKTSVSVLTQC